MSRTPWTSSPAYATKPAGRVWPLAPGLAGTLVLGPKLAKFARDYPDVILEVTVEDSLVDIVPGGFDAGIHFGEYIQKGHDRGPCVQGPSGGDRARTGIF